MWTLLQDWRMMAWLLGVPLLLGLIGHLFVFKVLRKITRQVGNAIIDSLVRHCYRPAQWAVVVLVIRVALLGTFPEDLPAGISQVMGLFLIAAVSWLLLSTVFVLEDFVASRFEVNVKDNLRARKIHTQFRVLKRIAVITIGLIALASMLMTFPKVSQLGATILASAGIIGIVVGMAAQRTIAAFIAGLQIAFTQPIRVDDVVIVENEWGRIEEITLTYVVVRIWDLRRLIVPITYFIEKPFQNWTRVSADILGTVFLYVDYTVPIEPVREQLRSVLKASPLWDGKVCALQVTNASERTVELRALMSAADASAAWDLRCEVREKLVDFIKANYPQALPRLRAELHELKSGEK